jgi:hypothetical protein
VTVVLRDAEVAAAMSRLHDVWFAEAEPLAPVEAAR